MSLPEGGPQTKVGSGPVVAPGLGVRIAASRGWTLSRLKAGEFTTALALPARSRAWPERRWPAPWVFTVSSPGHEAMPAPPVSAHFQSTTRPPRYQLLLPFGLEGRSEAEMVGAVRLTTTVTDP